MGPNDPADRGKDQRGRRRTLTNTQAPRHGDVRAVPPPRPTPRRQVCAEYYAVTQDLEAHGENYAETLKRLHALLQAWMDEGYM